MTVAETPEAPLSLHWQSYIVADGIPVAGSFHPIHARRSRYPRLPHCLTIPADASPITWRVFLAARIIACFDGSHRWSVYACRSIQPRPSRYLCHHL